MVFSSPVFIFLFLPFVYLINGFLPKKFSNLFLLIFSFLFYAWGEPLFVFLMLFSGGINYLLALAMDRSPDRKKQLLLFTVLFNVGLLGLFKYADFFILSINGLFATSIRPLHLPLPLGISFYTFQTLSYMIDVYRNETPVQKKFLNLLLYITFFPRLIVGPIVNYHDINMEIESRQVTLSGTANGLKRFVFGLSKKIFLANAMAHVADQLYSLPLHEMSTSVAWIAAIAYLFQIYFDFSGYSDMAIGLGEMFGFHFPENFNYPYLASSLKDFWRRWHISLSTWFRRYVYIPLGGNRKGKRRAVFNRILVFFLTGLWHGASWTFVVWGLYHGFFLLMEETFLHVSKWPRILRHVYTLLIVTIGFVIFRSESFSQALVLIKCMVTMTPNTIQGAGQLMLLLTPMTVFLFLLSTLATLPIGPWLLKKLPIATQEVSSYSIALLLWFACILSLAATTYNPFIYFRF